MEGVSDNFPPGDGDRDRITMLDVTVHPRRRIIRKLQIERYKTEKRQIPIAAKFNEI